MIRKYRYGTPFDTEALTEKIETTKGVLPYGEVSQEEGFVFTYIMDEDDIVYGLGEANRGINKRGYCYISNCTAASDYMAELFYDIISILTFKHVDIQVSIFARYLKGILSVISNIKGQF